MSVVNNSERKFSLVNIEDGEKTFTSCPYALQNRPRFDTHCRASPVETQSAVGKSHKIPEVSNFCYYQVPLLSTSALIDIFTT